MVLQGTVQKLRAGKPKTHPSANERTSVLYGKRSKSLPRSLNKKKKSKLALI
jgi:hypothetical protein